MKLSFFCLLILQVSFSLGQVFTDKENDRLFNPAKYATYFLHLDGSRATPVSLKCIKVVDIVDARADTLVLGYMKKGLIKTSKKIKFPTQGLTELLGFCNKALTPDTEQIKNDLLLVVKELWLSENNIDKDPGDNIKDINERMYSTSNVKIKFEFYLKDEEKYYPVCRFDTTIVDTIPLKVQATEFIENAIMLSLNKVAKYNLAGISASKTAVTLSSIYEYNDKRFLLPILNDTVLKKGIYVSFDEFKNNKPSLAEYEIKKGKLGDMLYTKSENGQWLVNRSVWGYCDGNFSFIKSGDNYFQLYRVGNSFYLNGSKEISRYDYYLYFPAGGTVYSQKIGKMYSNSLSPYKINIETGRLY